jgi:hypothetical protein
MGAGANMTAIASQQRLTLTAISQTLTVTMNCCQNYMKNFHSSVLTALVLLVLRHADAQLPPDFPTLTVTTN